MEKNFAEANVELQNNDPDISQCFNPQFNVALTLRVASIDTFTTTCETDKQN